MTTCQCPACQAQFQAAEDRPGGSRLCPDCRIQVRVPDLSLGPSSAEAGMITCECSRCRLKFQAAQWRMGSIQPCPDCNYPVQVGDTPRRSITTTVWITMAIISLGLVALGYAVLGKNANSAFGTVHVETGATLTGS
jgi:hypothetical protein